MVTLRFAGLNCCRHQLWKQATGTPARSTYSLLIVVHSTTLPAFHAALSTMLDQHICHKHLSLIISVPRWALSQKRSCFKFSFRSPSVVALQLACTLTVFMLPIFSFSSNVSSSLSFVVNKISRHARFWNQTRQSRKMKTTITATDVPQSQRSNAFPPSVYLWMSHLIE